MHCNKYSDLKVLSACRRRQLQEWLCSYDAWQLPRLLALRLDFPSRQGLLIIMAVLASLALSARCHGGLLLRS